MIPREAEVMLMALGLTIASIIVFFATILVCAHL